MITDLSIKNFRGLDDLKFEDFKQVTLLSGSNSVGKTSVLEAILLLFNTRGSDVFAFGLPNRVGEEERFWWRKQELESVFHPLFYRFDTNNSITVTADEFELKVNLDDNFVYKINEIDQTTTKAVRFQYFLEGKLHSDTSYVKNLGDDFYRRVVKKIVSSEQVFKVIMITHALDIYDLTSLELPVSQSLTQNKLVDLFNGFRQSSSDQEREELVQMLQILDPKINGIELGVTSTKLIRIELRKDGVLGTTPLALAGEGVKRLLSIILGILSAQDGIFLIDEIENGIYYENINKVWELIFSLTKKYNCQLIATTHSYEFASYVVNQSDEAKQRFAFVNFSRLRDETLGSSTYSFEEFEFAVHEKIEVR